MTSCSAVLLRALTIVLALFAPSCKNEPQPPPAEPYTVAMKLGSETFRLEIADTPRKQQLGLMHRKSLPADRGMLFVFEDDRERAFWMKNTHIPLDIVYADANGKVVSVKPMKPMDESSVPSDGPARYAVEINQGAARRAGLKAGDVLVIPPHVRQPADRRDRDR